MNKIVDKANEVLVQVQHYTSHHQNFFPCCELHLFMICSASNLVNFTLLLNSCLVKTCLVMPHVVNKAVQVQFKTKSAVVKEMLAPDEIKGQDRAEAEAANKTTTAARACTRNGRR